MQLVKLMSARIWVASDDACGPEVLMSFWRGIVSTSKVSALFAEIMPIDFHCQSWADFRLGGYKASLHGKGLAIQTI